MNKNKIIKLSNTVGIVSILLLIYWVFIFISITVFGFKVFRENITQSFYLSILGIISLLFGALMINIMFNLTKISDYVDKQIEKTEVKKKKYLSLFVLCSFPIIFILLFTGDKLTSYKKKNYLISSAKTITKQYPDKINALVDYSFTKNYIKKTEKILNLLSRTDKNFPYVNIIVKDSYLNSPVFLEIKSLLINYETKKPESKIAYIYSSSKEERNYLNSVFIKGNKKPRFSSHDGKYELFYPVKRGNKTIVIYFSEYRRYGKLGS